METQNHIRPVDVRILYTEGCPATPDTLDLVQSVAASLEIPLTLQTIRVGSPQQAVGLKFLGSPTVQVNGLDVDPAARYNTAYGFT